jgi:hypothetical protein
VAPTSHHLILTIQGTLPDSLVDRCGRRSEYKGCPHYGSSVIGLDPEGWWSSHAHMSLKEMRLEALKWTLDAENRMLELFTRSGRFENSELAREEWRERYIVPLERELAVRLKYSTDGQ